MDIQNKQIYYVVSLVTKYTSMQEVKEKASAELNSHLQRSNMLHTQGKLLMAGAFVSDSPITTMAIALSREDADDFVKGDPFVQKGMVSNWTIKEWANMFFQPDVTQGK